MEKGFNLAVNEFKANLINEINNSNMPISIVSMVLESILLEVKTQEKKVIDKEAADFQIQKEIAETETNQNGGN